MKETPTEPISHTVTGPMSLSKSLPVYRVQPGHSQLGLLKQLRKPLFVRVKDDLKRFDDSYIQTSTVSVFLFRKVL